MNLIDSIKEHEGFKDKPYPDPIHGWGVPTFGYGFTHINERQAEMVLKDMLKDIESELRRTSPIFSKIPIDAKFILIEMAYNIGISGLMKFKNMWKSLDEYDFKSASQHMLDSKWASQVSNRAHDLARRMSEING